MNVTTKRAIRTLELIDKPFKEPSASRRGFKTRLPYYHKNFDWARVKTLMEAFNRNRIAELAEEGR